MKKRRYPYWNKRQASGGKIPELYEKVLAMTEATDRAIPAGHIYLPAKPYPPEEIPASEQVPLLPQPYAAFRMIDPAELGYDLEHDEFFIPKGYVSEDGRIDENSVIWDWEKEEVTFQFVGEEAVTWKFWKAKNLRDMISGWGDAYYRRYFEQAREYIMQISEEQEED